MVISWFWLWLVFMFIFLSYGWGYRHWGPPYPRYVQRRRSAGAAANGAAAFDHHAWGWGGDVVWVMFIVGMVWVVAGIWRR